MGQRNMRLRHTRFITSDFFRDACRIKKLLSYLQTFAGCLEMELEEREKTGFLSKEQLEQMRVVLKRIYSNSLDGEGDLSALLPDESRTYAFDFWCVPRPADGSEPEIRRRWTALHGLQRDMSTTDKLALLAQEVADSCGVQWDEAAIYINRDGCDQDMVPVVVRNEPRAAPAPIAPSSPTAPGAVVVAAEPA